jgi:2-keto-4-pentenoate hydratase
MAGERSMDHQAAADTLLAARKAGSGPMLPPELRPASAADASEIQRLTIASLGPIGGWKVGAAGPDAPPSCAPMPASGLHTTPAALPGTVFTTRDIESEIAFVLASDLPPRPTPYTRAEIIAAIASCHPGIEVLQSRFADPAAADSLSNLADLIRHGAYVLGVPIPGWQSIDFAAVEVVQTIDGTTLRRRGNPAGDMVRLIAWLANVGAAWAGGLRAGQIVTCGSWTGATYSPAARHVEAAFDGAVPVVLEFN